MDEGNKDRIKRQLPKIPKSGRKSKSSGNISKNAAGIYSKSPNSSSSVSEQTSAFSPPGTKTRDFTGYSIDVVDSMDDGEDTSVTVAVRVRPFSDRELRLGAKQAITMNGQELVIDSKESTKTHHFCYDHCFWSFDRNSSEYASQETIYSSLAHPLLESAFEGYNTCLFAYGQTGSGKSYCIMGENSAPGIIPQFAEELFERIASETNQDNSFKVEVSYYEIYKERINDLLASVKRKKRVNLRVREHPVMGPYVEDLSTYVASTYTDIEQWLALGNRYRATAATGMNDRSSRSHSVFTLVLTQAKVIEDNTHSRVSRINLIDLAGSERSSISNTSGERLKEGASINKSLHTLSKVISLLAERSSGKRKKVYVPYRDSTLTWLLKESLGGNSKTAMIATVSPADLHREESLSTLRYAQQARSIVNVAKVNEDPQSKLIRDLRQEIDWLNAQLHMTNRDTTLDMADLLKSKEEMEQMKAKLSEYEKLMEETTRSWEERLKRTEDRKTEEAEQLKRAGVSFKVDNKLPNLVNLNEDPQLSEMLLYILKEGKTTVGRDTGSDIQLAGTLVAKNHCTIVNRNGEVILNPSANEEAQTFVNGTLLCSSTVLHHGDRLVIAGDHFFRFNHPLQVEQGLTRKSSTAKGRNFEYAREEFIKAQTERLEAERLKMKQEMMEKLEAAKQAADIELTMQKQTYEERLQNLEGTLVKKDMLVTEQLQQQENKEERIYELERQKRELEEETIAQRHIIELERLKTQEEYDEIEEQSNMLMKELELEKQKLEADLENLQKSQENWKHVDNDPSSSLDLIRGSELLTIATMIQEANIITKALMRPFTFSREDMVENDEITIMVKVTDAKKKMVTFWNKDKFESRLEQIRELYQHASVSSTCLDQEGIDEEWLSVAGSSDPFHIPEQEWVHDSLLNSYSPLSAGTDGKQQTSILSMFTPPGGIGSTHTPVSSITGLPKRALLGSVTSTPAGFSSFTPLSSPRKQAIQTITEICYDKMAPILSYQHCPSESIFSTLYDHLLKLKATVQKLSDSPSGELVLDVYLSLQLMLDSAHSLGTSVNMLGPDNEILSTVQCRSRECIQHMCQDISKQIGLYCSRLVKSVSSEASDTSMDECVSNINEGIEGVVSWIGQISICLRVEEIVCERDRQSSNPYILPPQEEDEHWLSLIQYGYQTWCSSILSETLRSFHVKSDQLQSVADKSSDNTIYSVREILGHATQLLYQITEVQELFWHITPDRATLDNIIVILSNVWRSCASVCSLCSLVLPPQTSSTISRYTDILISVNQQVSVWCEQTSISLVSFLHQTSTDDIIAEVQAMSKNIAMSTRSFNQRLKQRSISASSLEGVGLVFHTGSSMTLQTTTTNNDDDHATGTTTGTTPGTVSGTVSLPPDYFLPSPTPPHSDSHNGSSNISMESSDPDSSSSLV